MALSNAIVATQPKHTGEATNVNTTTSDEGRFVTVEPSGEDGGKTDVDIIAVPAVGADPKRTWIPYLLQRPRERTKPLSIPDLSASSPKAPYNAWSPKSIITDLSDKPPPSPQDIDQDGRDTSHGPWPITDLRGQVSQARILLYDHKVLEEGDTLETLAEDLLRRLCQVSVRRAASNLNDPLRKPRPLFFICHSTGGLVAKKALLLANQRKIFASIANDCYSMTFIATPHQGSAFLSSDEFWPSVCQVMRLRDIPQSVKKQFSLASEELRSMADDFRHWSTDLRINTFYETADSDLAFRPANDDIPRSYHVPIASVSSAIMDLEHEAETPLSSDHVGCATFEGDDDTFDNFVLELREAVQIAADLAKIKTYSMDLEADVRVEVNGFFEDEASSVKLWTARHSLTEFLERGPSALLEERLKRAQEPTKISYTKDDQKIASKQQMPKVSISAAAERPKSKIHDKVQNMLQRTISQDKPSLQPLPHLVRSSSDGQLGREPTESPSIQLQPNSEDIVRRNASVAAPVNGSVNRIKFSSLDHPNTLRHGSVAPTDPGPHMPAMNRLKLTWVHVPYTHTGWVPRVLERFAKENGHHFPLDFLREEHWASNHTHGRHAAPHAKYVKSSFVSPTKAVEVRSRVGSSRFAIYLQYLHWDTYKRLLERRLVIKRRMRQGRVQPIRQDIKDSESLENRMIWKYIGAHPPYHCRRTLDQYGYPNLRSTEARDDDQMLWKRTKPRSTARMHRRGSAKYPDQNLKYSPQPPRSQEKRHQYRSQDVDSDEALQRLMEESNANAQEGNVLMVDQLWLWALDEKTIITFFPKKEGVFAEGKLYQQGDLHDDIYNEVNSGLSSVPDAKDFASLIVQRSVTILLERTAHRHLQVLRIYEESISILIERMTRSYKSFRKEGFSVKPDLYDRNKDGEPMTADEKQERDKDVERQSKEDFSSLLELRDIYDELHTIRKLFKEQRDTLFVMAKYYIGETSSSATDLTAFVREAFEAHQGDNSGLKNIYETAKCLDAFDNQVVEMIDSAESAEKAYGSLLDIKQKQANVDESRLARAQIDATAAQGRSIMVFTIFTIIFLPLSFFTSVFGMNIKEWTDPGKPPALHRVVNFIGPISVGVIVITLTLAFSASIRSFAVLARKISVGVLGDVYHLISWPLNRASAAGRGVYSHIPTPGVREWIYNRYLRQRDMCYGQDYNVWDDYALPLSKSQRDLAIEQGRVSSSRRLSFLKIVKGEFNREKGEKIY